MYQNYPYYQQTPNPATTRTSQIPSQYQPQIGLKGRPVSSIEEVRATAVDFDGSIFFFPDLANKKIYTKQIAMDGSAILNMYELKQIPMETANINSSNYVTREEFESTLAQIRSLLEQQIQTPKEEQPQEKTFSF